jgi:hypothetical protein
VLSAGREKRRESWRRDDVSIVWRNGEREEVYERRRDLWWWGIIQSQSIMESLQFLDDFGLILI